MLNGEKNVSKYSKKARIFVRFVDVQTRVKDDWKSSCRDCTSGMQMSCIRKVKNTGSSSVKGM